MGFLSASSNICDAQITPSSVEYLNDLEPVILGLSVACGVITLLTVGIFVEVLCRLCKPPHSTGYPRRKALALLAIYPVTSFSALLAIIIPRSSGICDLWASLYFAFCLYIFCRMIFELFGDKQQMAERLQDQIVPTRSPPCCCCLVCLPTPKLTRRHLNMLDWCVRQFIVVRPTVMFCLAVLVGDNLLYGGTQISSNSAALQQVLSAVNTISTLVAVYGNVVLIRLSAEALPSFRAKFLLLQVVFLAESLQRLLLTVLSAAHVIGCLIPLNVEATKNMIHHMLLVAYMFVLMVVARKCYQEDFEILRKAQEEKKETTQDSNMDSKCDTEHSQNNFAMTPDQVYI